MKRYPSFANVAQGASSPSVMARPKVAVKAEPKDLSPPKPQPRVVVADLVGDRKDKDDAKKKQRQVSFNVVDREVNDIERTRGFFLKISPSLVAAVSFLLFSFVSFIYLSTSHPTVAGGDNGELVVSAFQWSVAHPPGYPLFTTIGYFLAHGLSIGSVAWRVSLISSLSNALASVFLFLTILRSTYSKSVSLFGALIFAFSPLTWQYSTHAEVFGLNNLFVCVLMFLMVTYEQTGSKSVLFSGAAICGLGMANQHTIVIFELPFICWMVFGGGALVESRNIMPSVRTIQQAAAVFFVFMLGPYAQLPFQQASPKLYSWGDTTTLFGLIRHILRFDYGTLQLYSGSDHANPITIIDKLDLFFSELQANTLYMGIPLGLLGIIVSLGWKHIIDEAVTNVLNKLDQMSGKRKIKNQSPNQGLPPPPIEENLRVMITRLGFCWLIAVLLYIIGFFSLCNLPIDRPLFRGVFIRFFMQPNIIFIYWTAIGANYIRCKFNLRDIFTFLVVILAVCLLFNSYDTQNQKRNTFVSDYGHWVIEPLPPNTILLTKGDLVCNSVIYLQICEGVRTDVKMLSLEHMTYPWFTRDHKQLYPSIVFPADRYHPSRPDGYSIGWFIDVNLPRHPIFIAGGLKDNDRSFDSKYRESPHALTTRVLKKEDTSVEGREIEIVMAAMPPEKELDYSITKYGPETWEWVVMWDFYHAQHILALTYLEEAIKIGEKSSQIHKQLSQNCVDIYKHVLDFHLAPPDYMHLNLGLCYDHLRKYYAGDLGKNLANEMLRHMRRYLSLTSPTDSNFQRVREILNQWSSFLRAEGRSLPEDDFVPSGYNPDLQQF